MFKNLHPGPSGGAGIPVLQSRFHYKTDRPENPMRCAMCGQINDMAKTPSGDAYDGVGMSYGAAATTTFNYPTPPGAKQITMTIHTVEPRRVGGCAFCGTMNEPGNLIGSSFGRNIDLQNL